MTKFKDFKTISMWTAAFLVVSALTSAGAEVEARRPVSLKANPTVENDVVHLGDLFNVTGPSAEVRVAAAPDFCQFLHIDAQSLARLAADNDLEWAPEDFRANVEVTRACRTASPNEIAGAIAGEMQNLLGGLEVEVRLLQSGLDLRGPSGSAAPVSVEILEHNTQMESFRARVGLEGGQSAVVSGTARQVMRIPVLGRTFQRGEVITEADLDWLPVRINSMSAHMISDAGELIGQAAKRPLRAGQALMKSDIERPMVIQKGALVTMTYDVPGMVLTDTGRALENGAIGATISVLNPRSHRTVLATVVSANTVQLAPSQPVVPGLQANLAQ